MLLISGAIHAFDIHAAAFVGGVAAALLWKVSLWKKWAESGWGSTLALTLLLLVITGFDTAYAPIPLLLLAVSFALMACGAGLWGLLSASLPRALGDITYSIYLLHGPLLFLAFRFLFGFDWVVQLNPIQYWCVVGLLVPVLLGISMCSFKFIEGPWLRKTADYTVRLRQLKISKVVQ